MAANNLRVIYDNLLDYGTTTVTADTVAGTYVAANVKRDAKSQTWRSTAKTATLTVSFGSPKTISGVILAFTNLTATDRKSVV